MKKKNLGKKIFRVVGFLAGFAAVSLSMASCAKKNAQTEGALEPLRLGVMTDSITDYVAAIGNAQDIFKKHGLKVDVTSFAAGINTIDAVTLGQLDIGGGADFAVLNRLGGSPDTPLRVFAGLGDVLNNSEFYTKEPSLTSLSDFAGKSVIVRLGTVDEYYNAKSFAAAGLPSGSVKFLPIDSLLEGVALIQNGSAQGMWANGKAAEMLEKMDGVRKIAKLSDYVSSTVHVGIATETFLREHQSAVVKYLLATQEIYDFIAADPQKAAEIMQKTNGTPIPQSLVTFTVWYNYIGFDQKVFDTMESLYQWANERGIIKNPYDLHKYIDVKALQAAFPGKGSFN